MKRKCAKRKKTPKWKDEFYILSYELSRAGAPNIKIAETLGMSVSTFAKHVRLRPALQEALRRGRESVTKRQENGQGAFRKYVFGMLPEDMRDVWEELEKVEKSRNRQERIGAVLENRGKRFRQHLFLYALFHYNFSMSNAAAAIGMNMQEIKLQWMNDKDFAELVDHIHEAKKDFFEASLIQLVKGGDAGATIFANRTINRDRGYNEKVDINVNNQTTHRLEVDNLPLELRKQLLDAMTGNQPQKQLTLGEMLDMEPDDENEPEHSNGRIIDVENTHSNGEE